MSDHAYAAPILAGIAASCSRIVSMDGNDIQLSTEVTDYVLPGQQIELRSSLLDFRFWVGLNRSHLFFSANLDRQSPYRAEQAFKTYFEAAGRIGWHVHFDVLDSTTLSLWADCQTDIQVPLACEKPSNGSGGACDEHLLTDAGVFWANEIAMMAQACLRTCERHTIRCSERAPMLP